MSEYFQGLPDARDAPLDQLKSKVNRLIQIIEAGENDGKLSGTNWREIGVTASLVTRISKDTLKSSDGRGG